MTESSDSTSTANDDFAAKSIQMPGFPEWLPGDAILERDLIAAISAGFESFGFQPLDTACVQPRDVLLAGGAQYSDGGVSKPIFEASDPAEGADARRLGLRYDLTVPLARYLAEQHADIAFPLRCFQIGKVWRAEKPSPRHWREFYQCDIDVIGKGDLHPYYDAEIAAAVTAAFDATGIGDFVVRISNRRVLAELLAVHGVRNDRTSAVVHIIDEGGRQPTAETVEQLVEAGLDAATAKDVGRLLECPTVDEARGLLEMRRADTSGLDELAVTMAAALDLGMPADRLSLDFSITRGHDYYTGTVFETFALGREHWGAIGSGGRYDDLLGHVMGVRCPGVGVSIGLTRLVGLMRDESVDAVTRRRVTVTAMTHGAGSTATLTRAVRELRRAGVPTQVIFEPVPAGVRPAAADGVVLLSAEADGRLGLRHIADGTPHEVDLDSLASTVRELAER